MPPNDPGSWFQCASILKPFTSLTLIQVSIVRPGPAPTSRLVEAFALAKVVVPSNCKALAILPAANEFAPEIAALFAPVRSVPLLSKAYDATAPLGSAAHSGVGV